MKNFVLVILHLPNGVLREGAGGSETITSTISPPPSSVGQAPTVRKYFPETWIWNCVDTVRFVIIAVKF